MMEHHTQRTREALNSGLAQPALSHPCLYGFQPVGRRWLLRDFLRSRWASRSTIKEVVDSPPQGLPTHREEVGSYSQMYVMPILSLLVRAAMTCSTK